jgi:hypothetical protein
MQPVALISVIRQASGFSQETPHSVGSAMQGRFHSTQDLINLSLKRWDGLVPSTHLSFSPISHKLFQVAPDHACGGSAEIREI